jgi:hypothetical protein
MSTRARFAASAALVLALAACGGSEKAKSSGSPLMRPGEDCLSCHHDFTAAGTVFAGSAASGAGLAGATVRIYGAAIDNDVAVSTNEAGNFYTTQALTYPATVSVTYGATTRGMTAALPSRAGCSAASCHGASFRVHVP